MAHLTLYDFLPASYSCFAAGRQFIARGGEKVLAIGVKRLEVAWGPSAEGRKYQRLTTFLGARE
jgi:hypothetical protein